MGKRVSIAFFSYLCKVKLKMDDDMTKKIITTSFLFAVAGLMNFATLSAQTSLDYQMSSPGDTCYTLTVETDSLVQACDDGVSDKALLDGFVQQCFDESLPTYQKPLRRSAAESLTGKDLLAYNYIKKLIVQVANGELESTAFTIPLSEFTTETGPWTAEDLGVSDIIVGNTLNSEVSDEIRRRMSFDFAKVHAALLADFPFELYWHDKIKGCTYRPFDSYSFNRNQVSIKGDASFTMYTSQDYAVVEGARYYPTRFDKVKIARVDVAVNTAKQIVEQSNGDILRHLRYYKDQICVLSSYNRAAAQTPQYPYGDPWQLVNVFDGDPTTTVVCEGYAKAFKYLCDLSAFKDVECLLASGTMDGGTGAGAHMWNVMKMEDGRSYLVDVTNCDEGTVGAPDLLFMVYGPSGDYAHGYTYPVRNGSITYMYDDDTMAMFSEHELTMSNEEYVPSSVISVISSVGKPADVFTLQGYRIRSNATSLEGLPKGLYIVNGRKAVVHTRYIPSKGT